MVACYIVRNPLSLKKLVYLDAQKAVLCRSKMNPNLGRNFEAMDPLEWLARVAGPHPRRRQRSHVLLWLLRQPRPGLSAGDRGVGRPGRANHQAALSPSCEAHQQGVPRPQGLAGDAPRSAPSGSGHSTRPPLLLGLRSYTGLCIMHRCGQADSMDRVRAGRSESVPRGRATHGRIRTPEGPARTSADRLEADGRRGHRCRRDPSPYGAGAPRLLHCSLRGRRLRLARVREAVAEDSRQGD